MLPRSRVLVMAIRLDNTGAAGERGDATAGNLGQAQVAHEFDEGVDLAGGASQFENETTKRGIDDVGAERIGDAHGLDALFAGADDFHQCQFTGNVGSVHGQVGDAMHRDQPVELGLDLFDHHAGAGRDDVDAAMQAGGIDRRDRQAVDVVAATRKQADDAREDAGLVVHEDRYRRAARGRVGRTEHLMNQTAKGKGYPSRQTGATGSCPAATG